MAYPIQPTPVLTGEAAERFYEMMKIWENNDYQLPDIHNPQRSRCGVCPANERGATFEGVEQRMTNFYGRISMGDEDL